MTDRPQTVPAMLERCARERADEIALSVMNARERRDLTYREWYRRSAHVAASLADRDVGRGVRVVLTCADDWISFAIAYVATQWAGGTAVPVSARMGTSHVQGVADRAGAAGVISDELITHATRWHASVTALEDEPA